MAYRWLVAVAWLALFWQAVAHGADEPAPDDGAASVKPDAAVDKDITELPGDSAVPKQPWSTPGWLSLPSGDEHLLPPEQAVGPVDELGGYHGAGQLGISQPLLRQSWMNRPYSAGLFAGALNLADPIDRRVDGGTGYIFGVRAGCDLDTYWGAETRLALSSPGIRDPNGIADMADANVFIWDADCLFYPLGDTRCRPFFLLGMGIFDFDLVDNQNQQVHETGFGLPLGVGVKYRYNSRCVFRLELIDNIGFSTGVENDMHNLSITGGFEARFGGGKRRHYWPWNPSRTWW